jgi:signal transduction histidine kinase
MQINPEPKNVTPQPPNILVVDDTPANLHLLSGMLKDRGCKVRPVSSGQEALQAARRIPPDLILLDINMPEMNGYEVCRRLKADPELKDIPVLFISALSETADKVKAFGAGGVDYVIKPFQFAEVDARVQTHLELRRQKRALQESYERLKELERLRDSLTHMIVHDMRSPLSAILGSLELLKAFMPAEPPELARMLHAARGSAAMLNEMVTQLLDISRLEAGKMPLHKTECDLAKIARDLIASLAPSTAGRQLRLSAPEPVTSLCDADIVRRVIGNLLGNALKFSPKEGEIGISVAREKTALRVAVKDNGSGIPSQYHQRIFEKFFQAESKEKKLGTGLGLTFCKLAVEAHGGRIGLDSQAGQGCTFWFTLPL